MALVLRITQRPAALSVDHGAWAARRRAVLWRRRHHAGHLGLERGRRPEDRDAAIEPYIVPIALVLLVGLFLRAAPRHRRIGKLFGPVMMLWFTILARSGSEESCTIRGCCSRWIRATGSPICSGTRHGLFDARRGFSRGTGAEALYADMGHFGAGDPRRLVWAGLAGLLLNYVGQTALCSATAAPRQSVLSAVPEGRSTRSSCSRPCDDHRLAGDHLRRLFL